MGKEEASVTDNTGQSVEPVATSQQLTPWSSVSGPSEIVSSSGPLVTTDESSLPGNRDETAGPVLENTARTKKSGCLSKTISTTQDLKESLKIVESAISKGDHFEIPPYLDCPNDSPLPPPLPMKQSDGSFNPDEDLTSIVSSDKDDLLTISSNSDVNKIFDISNSSLVKDFDKALKEKVPINRDLESLLTSDEDSLLDTSIEEVDGKDKLNLSVASDFEKLEVTVDIIKNTDKGNGTNNLLIIDSSVCKHGNGKETENSNKLPENVIGPYDMDKVDESNVTPSQAFDEEDQEVTSSDQVVSSSSSNKNNEQLSEKISGVSDVVDENSSSMHEERLSSENTLLTAPKVPVFNSANISEGNQKVKENSGGSNTFEEIVSEDANSSDLLCQKNVLCDKRNSTSNSCIEENSSLLSYKVSGDTSGSNEINEDFDSETYSGSANCEKDDDITNVVENISSGCEELVSVPCTDESNSIDDDVREPDDKTKEASCTLVKENLNKIDCSEVDQVSSSEDVLARGNHGSSQNQKLSISDNTSSISFEDGKKILSDSTGSSSSLCRFVKDESCNFDNKVICEHKSSKSPEIGERLSSEKTSCIQNLENANSFKERREVTSSEEQLSVCSQEAIPSLESEALDINISRNEENSLVESRKVIEENSQMTKDGTSDKASLDSEKCKNGNFSSSIKTSLEKDYLSPETELECNKTKNPSFNSQSCDSYPVKPKIDHSEVEKNDGKIDRYNEDSNSQSSNSKDLSTFLDYAKESGNKEIDLQHASQRSLKSVASNKDLSAYTSGIPLDVLIDEGENLMYPFSVSSDVPSSSLVQGCDDSSNVKFGILSSTDDIDEDEMIIPEVSIKVEENVDLGLSIKIEDMDIGAFSSSGNSSNRYDSVSVDVGDSNIPLSSFVRRHFDKRPLRSKSASIEKIAEKLVADRRYKPGATKQRHKLRDNYEKSEALLAAALGPGKIPKITSAIEILRVDSPKAFRKKPDLTPSVSLIPAEIAHGMPKSFDKNTLASPNLPDLSLLATSSSKASSIKDFNIPPHVLQLTNLQVELRNSSDNSSKSHIPTNTPSPPMTPSSVSVPQVVFNASSNQGMPYANVPSTIPRGIPLVFLTNPPPNQNFGSPLNIPHCYPPPPSIPQVIPRPRSKSLSARLPHHQYVEAFYRTKTGAIKKKFVKVPWQFRGKSDRDMSIPQPTPESPSQANCSPPILSNVDTVYSPGSSSSNSPQPYIPTKVSSVALHKQSDKSKLLDASKPQQASLCIRNKDETQNDSNKINLEFSTKEVGVPEGILNILLHDNNKTDNKTDNKTEKKKESIDKNLPLSTSSSVSLFKFPPSSSSGSEEVVFNSNDLKVILVQPESELHSSKKTSLIPLCDSSEKNHGAPPEIRYDLTDSPNGTDNSTSDKLKHDENILESIAPSKSPDIVLLPKSVAELTKESSSKQSDKSLQILKVLRFGAEKDVTDNRQGFIPLFLLGSNSSDTNSEQPSTDTPIVINDEASPKDTSNQGGRSGMVSRKVPGRRKHDAEHAVKKRTRLSTGTPPSDPAAQQDEAGKKIILSNVGRGCGGEVSIVEFPQALVDPVTADNAEPNQKEKQEAIHRLRRLGTDVSLEEHKVTKNAVSGDRVLVTPVEDGEHEPPAIKLLEDMAKSTELPVASPVLTALGQPTLRPKRKCHQNNFNSQLANVQTPPSDIRHNSFNGDTSKIPEGAKTETSSAQETSTNTLQSVESNVQNKLPSDDSVQNTNETSPSTVQKIARDLAQNLKSLEIVIVDKNLKLENSQSDGNQEGCDVTCQEIKSNSSDCIKVDVDSKINYSSNDEIKFNIEDSVEESDKKDDLEIAESKWKGGVFLIRPQHYAKIIEKKQVWCCDICTVVCTQFYLFRKHYLRLHISPKFISENDKEAWNIVEEQQSNEEKLFRCHVCKVHFDVKAELKNHLEHHPNQEESIITKSINQYICPHCDAVFKWRKPFGKHKKVCFENSRKTGKPTQHCLYCHETFYTPYKKKIHILSVHPYTRRKHTCIFCSKIFPSNISLFNHLVTQHSSHFFGCTTCKERFLNANELKAHYKKIHPTENFKLKTPPPVEREFFECSKCDRVFLFESCLDEHECTTRQPVEKEKQKRIKPLLIERKIETRRSTGETDFFSRVSLNIQDNLNNHLDGKLHPVDPPNQVESSHRTILNFNAAVPPTTSVTAPAPESSSFKSPNAPTYEKFNFPKEYDGRCGLTSFIKDASYLDISTQLIMRRNLQRFLSAETPSDPQGDVPAVLALERLGTQCAESFGTTEPPVQEEEEEYEGGERSVVRFEGELSGEWVRERTYVCATCLWQSPCLWTMEDHKYTVHPHVWTPQHELNTPNHKVISNFVYKRLADSKEAGKEERRERTSSRRERYECTKCKVNDIRTKPDLHRHIVECSGEDMEALEAVHNAAVVRLPTTKRKPKWRGGGRRTRQGLKRNIPNTPPRHIKRKNIKLLRTKPGDADTIEKMIANLPAKRATRRVLGFDEIDIKTRSQATIQNALPPPPAKKHAEKLSSQKKIQGIDTSAENGNVLSSLRMMPVKKLDVDIKERLPPELKVESMVVTCDADAEIPVLTPATTDESYEATAHIKSHEPQLTLPRLDPPSLEPVIKEENLESDSFINTSDDVSVTSAKAKSNSPTLTKGEISKPQKMSLLTPQIKLKTKIMKENLKTRRDRLTGQSKKPINQVKKEEMKKRGNTKKVQQWCLKDSIKEAKNANKTLKDWLIKNDTGKNQKPNIKLQKDMKKKSPIKNSKKLESKKNSPKNDNKVDSVKNTEIIPSSEKETPKKQMDKKNSATNKKKSVNKTNQTENSKKTSKNIVSKNTDNNKTKNSNLKASVKNEEILNDDKGIKLLESDKIYPESIVKTEEGVDNVESIDITVSKSISPNLVKESSSKVSTQNAEITKNKTKNDGKNAFKNHEKVPAVGCRSSARLSEIDKGSSSSSGNKSKAVKNSKNSPTCDIDIKVEKVDVDNSIVLNESGYSDKIEHSSENLDNTLNTEIKIEIKEEQDVTPKIQEVRKGRKRKSDSPEAAKLKEEKLAEEKRRKMELQKQREELKLLLEAEKKSLLEEKEKKKEELKKAKEEEKRRKNEEKRKKDEEALKQKELEKLLKETGKKKKIEMDKESEEKSLRLDEEELARKLMKEEEDKRIKEEKEKNLIELEEKRKEEEKRRKEDEKKQKEEEKKRKEEEKKRKQEEDRKRKEEERLRKEEEKKQKEEKKRKKEEETRIRKEEEEKQRKVADVQLKQEEDRKIKEEEKLRKEEEAHRKQEEDRKRKEEEKLRKEEEKKQKEEEKKRKKEEEERIRKEEEEKERKEEEAQRKQEEEDKKRKEEERLRKEEVKKQKEEEKKRKKEEEDRKHKEEEEKKLKEEEEARRKKEEEDKKHLEEEERKRMEKEIQLEEEKRQKEEEDRKCKEEEERKIKEEEAKEKKMREELKRKEEELKQREQELKRKELKEKTRRDQPNKRLPQQTQETLTTKGDKDMECFGEMSPRLYDSEDSKVSDTDSQKSLKLKLQRKRGQKKDFLKLSRLTLAQKIRKKKMLKKMKESGTVSDKGVVSSGTKWSVEVSIEDEKCQSQSEAVEMVDWLTEMPMSTPAVIDLVPPSKLMADTVSCASNANSTVQNSSVTSSSSALPPEQNWKDNYHSTSTNLGSILDSVNNLLNEPDLTMYSSPLMQQSLGPPQYSLADLQKAMGASDAEMAVLQQLGEINHKTEEPKEDEWPDLNIIDLDKQNSENFERNASLDAMSVSVGGACIGNTSSQNEPSISNLWDNNLHRPSSSYQSSANSNYPSSNMGVMIKGTENKPQCVISTNKFKDPSSSLLASHPAKEVVCPTCSSHFVGFPALQLHVSKYHPPSQQPIHHQSVLDAKIASVQRMSSNILLKPDHGTDKKPQCVMSTNMTRDPSCALLAAHPDKEVVCPTCSCHFVGFPALQLHISKYHPPPQPPIDHQSVLDAKIASVQRMSSNICHKQDLSMLNKRVLLESAKGCRLVCFRCQQILPSNLMSGHLVIEHLAKPGDITYCQVIQDPISNEIGVDKGDNLKNKMSSALGDLLERAVNNLVTAQQDGNSSLSGGAIQLLNKLSALRKKEESQQNKQALIDKDLKSYTKNKLQAALRKGLQSGLKPGNYPCGMCGDTFMWETSWRKHVMDIHTRPCGMPNVDDFPFDPENPEEDDWRAESGDEELTSHGKIGATPSQILPICSDCGLVFESMSKLLTHRNELHVRVVRRNSTKAVSGGSQMSSRPSSTCTSRSSTPVSSLITTPVSSSPPPTLSSSKPQQVAGKDTGMNSVPPSISPAPIDTPPTIVPEVAPTRLTRSSATYFNPPTPPPPVLIPEGDVKESSEADEEIASVKGTNVKPPPKKSAPVRRSGRSFSRSDVAEPSSETSTTKRSTRSDNVSARRSSTRLDSKPQNTNSNRKNNKNSDPSETGIQPPSNRRGSLKNQTSTELSSNDSVLSSLSTRGLKNQSNCDKPSASTTGDNSASTSSVSTATSVNSRTSSTKTGDNSTSTSTVSTATSVSSRTSLTKTGDNSTSSSTVSTPTSVSSRTSSTNKTKKRQKKIPGKPESRPKRVKTNFYDESVRKKAEDALRELNTHKSKQSHNKTFNSSIIRWRSAMTFSPRPKAEPQEKPKEKPSTSSATTVYDFVDDQPS